MLEAGILWLWDKACTSIFNAVFKRIIGNTVSENLKSSRSLKDSVGDLVRSYLESARMHYQSHDLHAELEKLIGDSCGACLDKVVPKYPILDIIAGQMNIWGPLISTITEQAGGSRTAHKMNGVINAIDIISKIQQLVSAWPTDDFVAKTIAPELTECIKRMTKNIHREGCQG